MTLKARAQSHWFGCSTTGGPLSGHSWRTGDLHRQTIIQNIIQSTAFTTWRKQFSQSCVVSMQLVLLRLFVAGYGHPAQTANETAVTEQAVTA